MLKCACSSSCNSFVLLYNTLHLNTGSISMATNSQIAVVLPSGQVKGVTVHFDGYVGGVGYELYTNYNSFDRAVEVCSHGNISVLCHSTECPPGHSWDTPVPGYTVFYGRDRKLPSEESVVYSSIDEFVWYISRPYVYLFTNNQWLVKELDSQFTSLGKLLDSMGLLYGVD